MRHAAADLFSVERSGADPNANVDVVVSDGGSVSCDGKEHPLDADRLLRARQLVRDLAPQAELGIELPPGPGTDLSYRVAMEAGSIAFSDRSPGVPRDLPARRGVHEGRDRAGLRDRALVAGR